MEGWVSGPMRRPYSLYTSILERESWIRDTVFRSVCDRGLGLWVHEAAVQPVCIDIRKGELIRDTFFRKRRRWRVEFLGP